MSRGKSLYDKLWEAHVVEERPGSPGLVYVDLHLLHDGTFSKAFSILQGRGLSVRRPGRAVAVTDHCVPVAGRADMPVDRMLPVVAGLLKVCAEHRIEVFGPGDARQGIVHVIAPELGLTQPGFSIICGDSHTPTLGAFGTLAFAVGTTQIAHALASQCVLVDRLTNMRVTVTGRLAPGVTAKDLILVLLARHGVTAGKGHAVEFTGEGVTALSMEERMTLCNMAAEMGAKVALIAPDAKTVDYLRGTAHAPAAFDAAAEDWLRWRSDPDAGFDRDLTISADAVTPMVTWGTSPDTALPLDGRVPEGGAEALTYMGLTAGQAIEGQAVGRVFIGSCTNARIEDLRLAARVLAGRQVSPGMMLQVVPGSVAVRAQAEAEGIAEVFRRAGAQWGEPGCGLCVCMNGEAAEAGEFVASTSNRNFPGRQGRGARTLLMSPATAAATAIAGCVADPRPYLEA
ncbi:3-isopropylmalate dehydratase large subunit [Szabonella alba]|uniref:3-isopropylmalate dehydratase n=1 Tax=Szabonella alba TaxID=2804194 RepID=A0A8K0VHF7_9RHOB|nr:3-isopropylmalate dehydratase large subunit [Szabonella alba]MBL4919225.1 3-isopropylmalate dehydratase large subunit [Szabonella alba]